MTKLTQGVLFVVALTASLFMVPSTAQAQGYWDNYWGWYDGYYRPFYNGYYYAAPSTYPYPNYGIQGTQFYGNNFYSTPYWPNYTTYPYYTNYGRGYRGYSWQFNWW